MARTARPLSATEIKQAKPKAKEYNLADGRGLALRVKPGGSKLWLFNYQKPFTKKRTNLSLGPFPAISLANARQQREELLALLAQQVDPKDHAEKLARQQLAAHALTFANVFQEWHSVKTSQVSPDYAVDIQRTFNLHVLPTLGQIPIHKIHVRQVIDLLKPLEARGNLETVKRVTQKLNEVMVYAVNTGQLETNPLSGVRSAFAAPKRRNLPTLISKDLPLLLRAINRASLRRTTRCLLEFQLHTMVRPAEAAGAKWAEIDLNKRVWHIPAERMKSKREHLVPLSDSALKILNEMQPISGHRSHVFPSESRPRQAMNSQTTNMAIKRMGFDGKLVAHGLRAIASTILNETGHDPNLIEAALAHKDHNETRSAYNRSNYFEPRKQLMADWSRILLETKASLDS